ncbi:Acyl-CoA-binding protein ACBP [Arabidopsis suecica]|uniref:Acyl-CoA-binding protein ACBP n=1 Tax=Arabidopsis suecica TaxID=45249 RepID=A0A8T1YJQ8_ARASU|nr:Acyl-CoA-binding protein ACBP [Arabidopsis suecica]
MEFFLEMLLTAVVALLFSFLVAKLVSLATVENRGNDLSSSDQAEKHEIGVGDEFVTEEVRFGMKMDARRVLESERNFQVVEDNVELVDRFQTVADRVYELAEAATGNAKICGDREKLVVLSAEAESSAAVSSENNVIVRGQDEQSDSAEEIGSDQREELMVRTTEAESTSSVSPENVVAEETKSQGQEGPIELGKSVCVEKEEGGGDVVVAESEELRVEESSDTVEESETEAENEEKTELTIEEDDDWEGIERSELEKAFAAAAKLLEESGKAEEIGAEAKMELFGLHKIATEGSCREAQPMAVMVTARAKWNAWQKLGNMSQEEAMEQYLALVSKEIPGLMNAGHTVGKMSEMETSVGLPPNSGSLEDPTNLDTTGVDESSKKGER